MTPTELAVRDTPSWSAPAVPLTITTPSEYERAADGLKEAKSFITRVKAFFKPHKQRLDEAKKGLLDSEKDALAPAEAFEVDVKQALATYDTEQERLRQIAQRELEAAARKAEEDRRLAEAAHLEAEAQATGDTELAAQATQMLEAPIETPYVAVAKSTPKVDGLSYRETWSAQVVDLHALVRYVAERPEMIGLLLPNQTALNAQARSLKGQMKLPGVKAVGTKTVASR